MSEFWLVECQQKVTIFNIFQIEMKILGPEGSRLLMKFSQFDVYVFVQCRPTMYMYVCHLK